MSLFLSLFCVAALASDPWSEVASVAEMSVPEVQAMMAGVERDQDILDRMARPWEAKPWHQYKTIFLTDSRVAGGVAFWEKHADQLKRVEEETGVPAQLIVAILGVETKYGAIQGSDQVSTALYTLGFFHERRGAFFRKELGYYLKLATDEGWDVHGRLGSYAGAMGMGQFIPSSYVRYAVDGDGDGQRDLFENPNDAIASVGNYFKAHGWRPGGPVLVPAQGAADTLQAHHSKGLKPDTTRQSLEQVGIGGLEAMPADTAVKLLRFQEQSAEDWRLALHNFYVITRYNHSALYARAVWELSERIAAER